MYGQQKILVAYNKQSAMFNRWQTGHRDCFLPIFNAKHSVYKYMCLFTCRLDQFYYWLPFVDNINLIKERIVLVTVKSLVMAKIQKVFSRPFNLHVNLVRRYSFLSASSSRFGKVVSSYKQAKLCSCIFRIKLSRLSSFLFYSLQTYLPTFAFKLSQ